MKTSHGRPMRFEPDVEFHHILLKRGADPVVTASRSGIRNEKRARVASRSWKESQVVDGCGSGD
jgi:hypothetical protein